MSAGGFQLRSPAKTAITDENTVVLLADFYRAGDSNDESFTALMIVSAGLARCPGLPDSA